MMSAPLSAFDRTEYALHDFFFNVRDTADAEVFLELRERYNGFRH